MRSKARITVCLLALVAGFALGGCPPAPPTTSQSLQTCVDACPAGMTCQPVGTMQLRSCVYVSKTGSACDVDEVVHDGACVQAQRRGRACENDDVCGPGYECRTNPVGGTPAQVCWPKLTDIDGTVGGTVYACGPGEVALGADPPAMCIAQCPALQAPCQPNQGCQPSTGTCAAIDPILRACTKDDDCTSDPLRIDPPLPTYYCAEGQCLPRLLGCASKVDCPSGFVCGAARLCEKEPPRVTPVALEYCPDLDGDGYCASSGCRTEPAPGPGPLWHPDCRPREDAACDGNGAQHPGVPEVCGDGVDNDCAGGDLACPPLTTYYRDGDGDGYCGESQQATSPPGAGWVTTCRSEPAPCENDATRNPGKKEICGNGKDEDCRGGDEVCHFECPASTPLKCECTGGFVSACMSSTACMQHHSHCGGNPPRDESCSCERR